MRRRIWLGPVWVRHASFVFEGLEYDAEEWFFQYRLPGAGNELAMDGSGWNDVERRTISSYRWWTVAELQALEATVYPQQLGELLPDVLNGQWDGHTREVR